MNEIDVIEDPHAAEVSLHPIRARMLRELAHDGSASSVAKTLGLTRQKANYHLRALEASGLVELVEERRRGNTTERLVRATAGSYVISPATMPELAPDPDRAPDQLSARWLLALAGRMVQELGTLIGRSRAAGQTLASFGIDSEVAFANAAERARFAAELADDIERLIARYHAGNAPRARRHRLIIALHPAITKPHPNPDPGAPSTGEAKE